MTNDVLAGTWFESFCIDYCIEMDLVPGPDGVYGTFTLSAVGCPGGGYCSGTVTTLPDLRLRLTYQDGVTADYHVEIVPVCPGEPRPTGWPDPLRIHIVQLGSPLLDEPHTFVRDAPKPICSAIQPG